MIVLNVFSFGMLRGHSTMDIKELSTREAIDAAHGNPIVSAVGHRGTANIFAAILGEDIAVTRHTIHLRKGDVVLLGNYRGPQLGDDSFTLPEGSEIRWFLITIS